MKPSCPHCGSYNIEYPLDAIVVYASAVVGDSGLIGIVNAETGKAIYYDEFKTINEGELKWCRSCTAEFD